MSREVAVTSYRRATASYAASSVSDAWRHASWCATCSQRVDDMIGAERRGASAREASVLHGRDAELLVVKFSLSGIRSRCPLSCTKDHGLQWLKPTQAYLWR